MAKPYVHHEYPKMVYKKEETKVLQHKDEVGYAHKVVHSEEEHEKAASEGYGEHPAHAKEEKKEEKKQEKIKLPLKADKAD